MPTFQFESQSTVSGRIAVFEQSEKSAWLYLLSSQGDGIQRDAFAYSLVTPNRVFDREEIAQGNPPTLVTEFASQVAVRVGIDAQQLNLLWSLDGESVALMIGDEPLAMIVATYPRGFSKALVGESGFGMQWRDDVFNAHFRACL